MYFAFEVVQVSRLKRGSKHFRIWQVQIHLNIVKGAVNKQESYYSQEIVT